MPEGGPGIERVGNIVELITWALPRAVIVLAVLAVGYLIWSLIKNRHRKK